MQFQVDAGDSRPTFFELIAADRLVPSLRAALVYSLGVLAARRPGLTRILDHEAEAFAALMLLVETHSFATSDGSLAEGLYGLQRSRRVGGVGGARRGRARGGAREGRTPIATRRR
jgi:peroxin-12